MRILMIAPEPCFQPRGTPFSVYHRIVALLQLGHQVDLVTYHLGNDAQLEGLRIFRSARVPWITNVKVGPSRAKFLLDALLAWRCVGLLLHQRYAAIHTHEEAGFLGVILGWLTRTPHVYDMHSDLEQQLINFRFTRNRLLLGLMRRVQRFIVRGSTAVIVICPDLERRVRELAPHKRVVLIENTSMLGSFREPSEDEVRHLRRTLGLDGRRVLLYTGTMEPYQGLDVLLESAPAVIAQHPQALYLLVGGQEKQIRALQARAEALGLQDHVRFLGPRPAEEMWTFMQLAEILVSPRLQGTNTPLKIYAYLRSGRPILATDLLTHTQVLNPATALLVEPSATGLAQGALRLLGDPALARQLAENAARFAEAQYSYRTFLERTALVYEDLGKAQS